MSSYNFLKYLFVVTFLCKKTYSTKVNSTHALQYAIQLERYDINFVYNITLQLHRMNSFDCFIVYCSHCEERRTPYIIASSLEQVLIEELEIPVIVWGWNKKERLQETCLSSRKMVLVNLIGVDDDMLDVVDDTLSGIHDLPIMFFILRRMNESIILSYDDLMRFFDRCWHKKFLKIFLTFEILDKFGKPQVFIYSYTPFPSINILDLSNSIETVNRTVINNIITDVQGFRFHAPLFHNPPLVYLRNTTSTNPMDMLSGFIGLSFFAYIKLINATATVDYYANVNVFNFYEHLLLEATSNRVHVCLNPITHMQPNANLTATTFPIGMTNFCIIVPVVPELPASEYLSQTRNLRKWDQLFLLWILLLILKYMNQQVWNFSETLYHSCSILFTQSLPYPEFQRQRVSYKFFYLSVTLWAVIYYSAKNAYMASVLSTRLMGRQIYTVDDFLATDLKILAVDFIRKVFFDTNRLPSELRSRLEYTDEENLLKQMWNLNRSYAYVFHGGGWDLLKKQQRRLKQPLFRIASKELCTVDQFMQLPIQWDSPFERSMYRFFLNSEETGLRQKWLVRSHDEAIHDGLLTIFEDTCDDFKPLPLEFYKWPIQFYFCMNVVCIFCFIVELSIKRMQEKQTK